MENRDIAAVFEEISNLMKIVQDDSKWSFKAAAYDRAKRSLESYPERLEDIARDRIVNSPTFPASAPIWPRRSASSLRPANPPITRSNSRRSRGAFSTCCNFKLWVRKKCGCFSSKRISAAWTNWKPPPKRAACAPCRE